MKKYGFTLVELLVVIAIIAILSVIIVPSVITVNKNVNERLYQHKIDNIVSAAELYASNNPDIFNGSENVYVYVYQLIDADYLKVDSKFGQGACKEGSSTNISKGCIVDPRTDSDKVILNNEKILLSKKTIGIVGEYDDGTGPDGILVDSDTLVNAVCDRFANGTFKGVSEVKEDGTVVECNCGEKNSEGNYVDLSTGEACLIVSDSKTGNVNNWLKYGSSEANWRVLGIYKVNGVLYPKMITADVID